MFKKVFAITLLSMSTAFAGVDFEQLNKATVMITDKSESGGGTGVILQSGADKSTILTNAHVCGVVKNGGLVHSSKGKVSVERYTVSAQHDLCLVEVMADLETNTKVAARAPKLMDKTYVSGHPYLFPTTITEGHFANSMIIQIISDVRECTKEEMKENGDLCFWFGGMPIIREYNTNTVSNMIAPGNSGSAVYNGSGELVGLVFAGAGRGLSPGIIVPFEYLKSFIDTELKNGKLKTVETAVGKKLSDLMATTTASSEETAKDKIKVTKLVFAAIKSPTLDKIESKLKNCSRFEEYGCLNSFR